LLGDASTIRSLRDRIRTLLTGRCRRGEVRFSNPNGHTINSNYSYESHTNLLKPLSHNPLPTDSATSPDT
jgi:hypothetical protein